MKYNEVSDAGHQYAILKTNASYEHKVNYQGRTDKQSISHTLGKQPHPEKAIKTSATRKLFTINIMPVQEALKFRFKSDRRTCGLGGILSTKLNFGKGRLK